MSVLYFSDTRTSTEKPSKHTKIIEPHGYKLLRQVWALVQAECHDPPSVFPTEQKNPISGIMRVDYNDSRVVLALAYPLWGKDRYAAQRSPHTQEEKHLTEFEAMEIVGLIRSGLPAQEACRLVNVPQSTLTAALTAARKQADNATEKQKLLLKGYEDAQARRSKLLRKRHETGQPLPSGKAVIYRDLLTFPAEVKEKIFAHLRHGSTPPDSAEAEQLHASIMRAWLERGFAAFLDGGEDGESVAYRTFFIETCQAMSQARTDATERTFADSPLAWNLYGGGRETADRPGWQKNAKVVHQEETAARNIQTRWATASHPLQIQGGQPPYKVEYPEGYQPLDRSAWPTQEEG